MPIDDEPIWYMILEGVAIMMLSAAIVLNVQEIRAEHRLICQGYDKALHTKHDCPPSFYVPLSIN